MLFFSNKPLNTGPVSVTEEKWEGSALMPKPRLPGLNGCCGSGFWFPARSCGTLVRSCWKPLPRLQCQCQQGVEGACMTAPEKWLLGRCGKRLIRSHESSVRSFQDPGPTAIASSLVALAAGDLLGVRSSTVVDLATEADCFILPG